MRGNAKLFAPRLAAVLAALIAATPWTSWEPAQAASLDGLAQQLWSASPALAERAVGELRTAGPAGMAAALAAKEGCTADSCASPAALARLDTLCGVRDCADIRLFWYTNFDEAKRVAAREGKPLVSLALLGRLDEELSCANSRFFRTALYPNAAISKLLSEDFVLHWRSVRAVPKITIDAGDGRILEQTITGNSVHFFLDRHGRLLDALPGLYGPQVFYRELSAVLDAEKDSHNLTRQAFDDWNIARLRGKIVRIRGEAAPVLAERKPSSAKPGVLSGRALDSVSSTGSKSIAITPVLAGLGFDLSDQEVDRLAARRRDGVHLDVKSRAYLRQKHGLKTGEDATRLIANFEADIALDEVLNETRYRPPVLQQLARYSGEAIDTAALVGLTVWVYEEVFRDPIHDPWLGLVRRDIYAALPLPADRP